MTKPKEATHAVLERRLRQLGRGFTAHDVSELYGCLITSAHRLLWKWERQGRVRRVKMVKVPQTGRGCTLFVFADQPDTPEAAQNNN